MVCRRTLPALPKRPGAGVHSIFDLSISRTSGLRIAAVAKEILKNRRAFVLKNSGSDVAPVIQTRQLQQVDNTSGCSSARIGAAENNAAHPHMHKRAGTHRAWLFGNVEVAIE